MAGDVIGCTFDLDNGEISYYRYSVIVFHLTKIYYYHRICVF